MESKPQKPEQLPPVAAERLTKMIEGKKVIPFHLEMPDKEYPDIKCSIYGAIQTNELFVRLVGNGREFVEAVDSPLLFPCMVGRIFGMDVQDHSCAFALADKMWGKYQVELRQSGSGETAKADLSGPR